MTMEKFHYKPKASGSKEIVLPHFKQVPFGILRKTRKLDEATQLCEALEAVADAKTLEQLDALTIDEFGDFTKAWQEEAQVSLGESEAS